MEGVPVPLENNPEYNIYIRQVGKNENSQGSLPSTQT
jgi:hypothetical protein